MPLSDFLKTRDEAKETYRYRRIYPLLAIIMVIMLYCVYYQFSLGKRLISRDAPLIGGLTEIKYEISNAHLMFTQSVQPATGRQDDYDLENRLLKIEKIYKGLENSESYLKALLDGGRVKKLTIEKTDDPILRKDIAPLRIQVAKLKEITEKLEDSLTDKKEFPPNLRARYDNISQELIASIEAIDVRIHQLISDKVSGFDSTVNIIFFTYLLLFAVLITLFYLFEKTRAHHYEKIEEAKRDAQTKEQWLRTTMRSMGDALISTDTTGRVTYLNPVASSLTGWTAEEALGKNIGEVFHIVNEKTRRPVTNPIQEVLKKKYIVGLANHTALISRSGKEYPIADSGAPIIDSRGECIGAVLVFQDVTEKAEAEKRLNKSKREWEKSFNAIRDIITIQDKDMRILRANSAACAMFGAKEEDLIGRFCYELFNADLKICPECPLVKDREDLLHQETVISQEKLGKTFKVSIAPVFDENFDLESFVHSAKDVTQNIQLEEDLYQARKMEAIGTLAGGIAHDFNNMLSVIMGYTELLADFHNKAQTPEEPREYLEKIQQGSEQARALVKQILTFSRRAKGEQYGPIDPKFIITESLKLLRSSIPTTIDIQKDIESSCGTIVADPTKIQQILVNLCANSAQAMEGEVGIIRVKLNRTELSKEEIGNPKIPPGPFVELTVSDNGRGINSSILDHIFEPYFTTKKLGKGTGLGLSMVKGIVDEYNGLIRVDTKVGKGSAFHIFLPVIDAEESLKIENKEEIRGGGERILIVDDEEIIVGLYKTSLQKLGYKVTGTTSSSKALELFKDNPEGYDLLITDQTMPAMTGVELAKLVLNIRPKLPIIINTGYNSKISEDETKDLNIRALIMKPVSRSTLAATIRNVLDKG